MRRSALCAAAIAAAMSVTMAPVAMAQKASSGAKVSAQDTARARSLFEKGITLSDEGKWAEALDAFRESDSLVASAKARFNMGVSLRALGRYVEAKRVLGDLLAERDGLKLKPDLRAETEKLQGEVTDKVVRVHVSVSPSGAKLEIDGETSQLDALGNADLDPGKHVFVVSAEGHETTTVNKTLGSGKADVVLNAPPKKVVEKRVEVPVESAPVYKRAWFWVGISAVVAGGAATGVYFAVQPTKSPGSKPISTSDVYVSASFKF